MGRCLRATSLVLLGLLSSRALSAEPERKPDLNPPPTAADWAALARLPDWSGIWVPNINDQHRQLTANPTPWTPKVGAVIDHMWSELKAGRPAPLFVNCLPEGMPSSQRDRGAPYAGPRHPAGRIRRQPAAANLYRRPPASRGS